MKKTYYTPELNVLCVETKDILTLSGGEGGDMTSYSFNDIVNGWTQA